MSRTRTRRLLWLAGALLLPLPWLFMYTGAVPVARYVFLAGISGAYAGLIDGSEVAWPMTAIVAVHALVYAGALWGASAVLARFIPARLRAPLVVTVFVVGFTVALAYPIYETPMDDERAHTNWVGLFQ